MPQVATIIFDNAINSQNQDYLPSRYVLQKEVIDILITNVLENDVQSLIGLIPIAQKDNNDILTPTNVREHLTTFLYQRDLHIQSSHLLALFQADQSLQISDISNKSILMFLGSPIENIDEMLAGIYNIAAKGTLIKVVCFAEAREFGKYLEEGAVFENIHVLFIDPRDDFNQTALTFFMSSNDAGYVDNDLEEAIRRSLVEK